MIYMDQDSADPVKKKFTFDAHVPEQLLFCLGTIQITINDNNPWQPFPHY